MALKLLETLCRFGFQERFFRRWRPVLPNCTEISPSSFFDRVQVISLERRPDRWRKTSERLARAGITAQRHVAADCLDNEVAAGYFEYRQAILDTEAIALREPLTEQDVYRSGDHDRRVESLRQHWGEPPVKSAGGYAYLHSWSSILRDAIRDRIDSLLVMDDDVVFHKDIGQAFARVVRQLPDDWAVLQLGTLRRRGLRRLRWWSPWLFMNEGRSVGSHAVGLSSKVFGELLDLTLRRDAVFDNGALSTLTWRHRNHSFVTFPDLAIQEWVDSDIDPNFSQNEFERVKTARRFHWKLENYDF
jgi:hypothetical protein